MPCKSHFPSLRGHAIFWIRVGPLEFKDRSPHTCDPLRQTVDMFPTQSECTQTHIPQPEWNIATARSPEQEQVQCLGFTYLAHPCRHTRTTHNMQLPLHTHTTHALSHGNIPHTCIRTFLHTKFTHLMLTYPSKSHQRSFCYHLIAAKHSPHSTYLHSYPYPCLYLSMCLRTHTHTHSQVYAHTDMPCLCPAYIYPLFIS